MDKVTIIDYDRIYKNFIDEKYLHDGHDEYYYRNQQVRSRSLRAVGVTCAPTRSSVW